MYGYWKVRRRDWSARASAALVVALLAAGATGARARIASSERDSSAQAARALDGTDTAQLHLVHQVEALLYEEGAATGALPGRMQAKLTVGSLFKGTCTIRTAHGSITGHGVATPHGTGHYQSFRGTFSITGGSGRYAHVHGRTRLYGTFDRITFALVVQTTGTLSY